MSKFSWNYIRLTWKYEWRYFHRDVAYGLKNLYYWFPVIWKTREWDHHFFYSILRFKLERMALYNKKYPRYVGVERNIELMNTCINLIEKLEGDYYASEYHPYYELDIEFVNTDKEGFSEMKSTVTEDNLDEYFIKYPNEFRKVRSEYPKLNLSKDKDRMMIALYMGARRHEKAKELVFKLFNTHLENWWN